MTETFLLFAGKDYYPNGGAQDCVGTFESSHEATAIQWAEQFDTDTGQWWTHADWKHLARLGASGLSIVGAWTRDSELVRVEGGHRSEMGPWQIDTREQDG